MNNFLDIINKEPTERVESIKKLESFLLNPGKFSILVLGDYGTGKTHWIKEIQKNNQDKEFLKKIFFLNAGTLKNSNTKEYWEAQFKLAHKNLLVIEDVELLTKDSQEILFEGLSTGLGAKYGFDDKTYQFRIAFTSSYSIGELRDKDIYLNKRFFGRIAQLVVKFPSIKNSKDFVWNDFLKSWKKMAFENKNEIPGSELSLWLLQNYREIHGNFRDLDKIAINWHNYRLMGTKESEILKLVIADFKILYHLPEQKSENKSIFIIDNSLDWEGNFTNFKSKFKEWVKEEYGSLKEGAEKVKISYRTMERW